MTKAEIITIIHNMPQEYKDVACYHIHRSNPVNDFVRNRAGACHNEGRGWSVYFSSRATKENLLNVLQAMLDEIAVHFGTDAARAVYAGYLPAWAAEPAAEPAAGQLVSVKGQSAHFATLAGYAAELNDYRDSSSYICDAAAQIADNNTSIYYSDITTFISDHVEEVNDVINEFGWDVCGGDLYKAGQMAEYLEIERDILNGLKEGLLVCAYDFLAYDLKIEEIPEELDELIQDWCADADIDDRMDEIPDKIREWLDEHNGEEEDGGV